ncbi:MAG: TMEM175 family protein [Candidatus Omnitrophica bacterium]|nr:TMEM175 family protein [Candidatus Omnitrophota bacterium]
MHASREKDAQAAEDKLFRYGAFTKNRVETFSDGVFAIIVTLLILEIKVPDIQEPGSVLALRDSLTALLPKFVSWVISFLTICIVWMNHHRLFDMFKGINVGLFWLNVNLLLWVCFVPFPTALMGDYPRNPLAVAFYGAVMACAGISFILARLYGLKHKSLLKDTVSLKKYKRAILFAFIFAVCLYCAGAALAWVNTYVSFAFYFLVGVYFVFSFATKE